MLQGVHKAAEFVFGNPNQRVLEIIGDSVILRYTRLEPAEQTAEEPGHDITASDNHASAAVTTAPRVLVGFEVQNPDGSRVVAVHASKPDS